MDQFSALVQQAAQLGWKGKGGGRREDASLPGQGCKRDCRVSSSPPCHQDRTHSWHYRLTQRSTQSPFALVLAKSQKKQAPFLQFEIRGLHNLNPHIAGARTNSVLFWFDWGILRCRSRTWEMALHRNLAWVLISCLHYSSLQDDSYQVRLLNATHSDTCQR